MFVECLAVVNCRHCLLLSGRSAGGDFDRPTLQLWECFRAEGNMFGIATQAVPGVRRLQIPDESLFDGRTDSSAKKSARAMDSSG